MGERFAWFTDKLEQFGEIDCLTPSQFIGLIEEYLARFNEEIDTIKYKQSISKNRVNQHANRLSILEMNIEREKGEFDGAGIGKIEIIMVYVIQPI